MLIIVIIQTGSVADDHSLSLNSQFNRPVNPAVVTNIIPVYSVDGRAGYHSENGECAVIKSESR